MVHGFGNNQRNAAADKYKYREPTETKTYERVKDTKSTIERLPVYNKRLVVQSLILSFV